MIQRSLASHPRLSASRAPADLDYRYVIGIDLGTTNSAVAYVDLGETPAEGARRAIRFFAVPQLVGPGETAERPILPSFLYLPGAYDLPEGSTALPWDADRDYVVGEFAREQGARVPGRLVASAKSWLCHAGVDRTAGILPWGTHDEVQQVSPVAASMRYLQHVREAWNARMGDDREGYAFEEQLVILTVPASFDEVARELTVTAAHDAGIPRVILLEEPLAAFYAWLSDHEDTWADDMGDGQLILVCDVGGGTTDFSIVGIREGESGLRFTRLAVGDHLMLGGDNMDLALGRHVEASLLGQPGKLDAARWPQLVHQCRRAKEALLTDDADHDAADVTVMGQAGQLIGGTLKTRLTRDEISELLLDGFFPDTTLDDPPTSTPRRGLTEMGLPYVADPAVTRHLAAFWRRFQTYLHEETGRTTLFPDFVLFNGGVLTPTAIRERLRALVGRWFAEAAGDGWAPVELANPRPELAVAVGAAYYGMVRQGEGIRVGSGSPRAYYVGVHLQTDDTGDDLYPAVCLVPRGTEEGFAVQLDAPAFEALANQPVAFNVYTSSTRLGDALGEVVQLPPEEVTVLPPIRTVLRYGRKGAARRLPVRLAVRLTEIGTLELWCQAEQSDHRWQLQFDVRQGVRPDEAGQIAGATLDQALIDDAAREIAATFAADDRAHKPRRLRRRLEEVLEMNRGDWPTPLIRKLADAFLEADDGRRLTPQHEARWLNLLGYCLRPGFGDPVDEWRMKQVWKLQFDELIHAREAQARTEWWIFWRRVAGGLSAGQQTHLYQQVAPYLFGGKKKPSRMFPKRIDDAEELEIWMALANCERLAADVKVKLGRRLLQTFEQRPPTTKELWALSRLGARQTIYGPLDRLVPRAEAGAWVEALLAHPPGEADNLAHALVNLARTTGDRARDVPETVRDRVLHHLDRLDDAERYRDLLTNPDSTHRRDEQDWMFGEALPAGLVLYAEEETG